MKVALINPFYGLPVPATMGGAVEELMTIILENHEKTESDIEFYYFQKELDKADKKYKPEVKYKKSEIVFVKYNKFLTTLQRAFGKLCKLLHIKKKLPYYVPLDYHKKVFKQVKKLNPDLIIFENNLDSYVKKYIKHFGKEKLYFHCHIQDIPQYRIDKYVAGVIGVSNFITTDYEEFVGKDKKMNNYVVLNCVNEDKFLKHVSQKEKNEIRENLGFKKDDFVVIYCGRIIEKKGVDKLCEAMLKTPDNVKLMLIGSPGSIKNDKTGFVKEITKIVDDNSEKIKFTGYINNAELYKYYQTADLQVVPTMMEEAAGLVVIEGQLCGAPQIITKSGGMVEYVPKEAIQIDRFDNMVDNLAKNIVELSKDKDRLKIMSEASKENSKKYRKNDFYNSFIKMIEDINRKT